VSVLLATFFQKVFVMACATPFDAFRLATEHLTDDIYRKASYRSIWLNLIPREEFPSGVGLTQSIFTLGRSEPTDDLPDFSAIALSTNGTYTGSCGDTYTDVPVGFNESTFSPEQFAWKGPVICQDDLIYNHKAEAFLQGYIPAITKHTERTISNRLAAIYTHYSRKAVANSDFHSVAGQTGLAPKAPVLTLDQSTCELSQEMLDHVAVELNQAGASDPNSDGWINLGEDGPIYPLYIGQEASQKLQLDNTELRADYRNAYMGAGEANPLLKRVGATRVIRNFRHVINLFPPRYNYTGGAYVRVNTWVMNNGTKGQVADINPSYLSATYEGAYVLNPWVFHDQIIKPVNSAAGLTWEPKSYMGEWQFEIGGNRINNPPCYDPQNKLGAHFASFKHAAKPIFPEYGYTIIYKRCAGNSFACTSCS
jgi:hypothetical protein